MAGDRDTPADRLTRFTGRGEVYARSRPSYPPAAIDALLDGLGDPARLAAADVGAGTGISARLLADRGVRVVAIEPNADMRAAAAAHERVEQREGLGEETGLPEGSVDLVLCAQSFHWMDPPRALAEFVRILRPGGRVAIMWNVVDDCTPVGAAYLEIIRRHATAPLTSPGHTKAHETTLGVLAAAEGLAGARELLFTHAQRLDLDVFVGRAASSSYCPRFGYAFEAMAADLAQAFDRHAAEDERGERRVELAYRTYVFLSEREAP